MLSVININSYYGETQVLYDLSIEVNQGEVVTLLGRNGMGKTTTIRSIMGLVQPRSGSITFRDKNITGWPAFKIARAGIALLQKAGTYFPNLNVKKTSLQPQTIEIKFPTHGRWTKS